MYVYEQELTMMSKEEKRFISIPTVPLSLRGAKIRCGSSGQETNYPVPLSVSPSLHTPGLILQRSFIFQSLGQLSDISYSNLGEKLIWEYFSDDFEFGNFLNFF